MDAAQDKMDPYLEHLDALAFVKEVRVLEWRPEGMPGRPTAIVLIRTNTGQAHRFLVQQTGSFPTYAFLDALAAQNADGIGGLPWILFAPKITTAQGERLRDAGLCYLDRSGNCRVALGKDHVALVAGLETEKPLRAKDRGLRAAGYKIIFALLAKPELLQAPVRDIAVAAGAGKTAVAQLLRQLADDRILVKIRTAWAFADAERLMRRWLEGYASTLRPSLLIGRFLPSDRTVQELEERVEGELANLRWAWGGTAAANRIDGYYRGNETVLLVESPFDVTRRLRAPKRADGPLIVMKAPGPVAFDGPEDHVVHPLLAYAEMLATDDPRSLEAAERVRERFLDVPA